jgi:hypothetical protein
MSSKKRKSPKWRSIKIHADVYERLRAKQKEVRAAGWRAMGFPSVDGEATLNTIIDIALAEM